MFENAKEYLARVVPWPSPGEPGFVNLHWTFPPPIPRPDGKPAWTGRAVTSVGEAAKALGFALRANSNTLDVYACMSQQAVCEPKTSKGKKPFNYNSPVRNASGALLLKSFFLDVDYGKLLKDGNPDPKCYATGNEALDAITDFIIKVHLPKPTMVVSTGGGFHVYWCVSGALSPPEWLPIAHALVNAARQHGLKCDTQCTIDSARVLRIPDTYNRKKALQRDVKFIGTRLDFDYLLDRVRDPLASYFGVLPPAAAAAFAVDLRVFPPRKNIYGDTPELSLGLDDRSRPVDLDVVAQSCGFLQDALATGGAALGNPLWNLTTLIATFTKGKLQDAHRLGDKHATYTRQTTDELYARKDRERTERGIGWPSCSVIAASGGKACGTCPLLAQGKSPLNFELQVPQAAAPVQQLLLSNSGQAVQQANAPAPAVANAGAFGPAVSASAAVQPASFIGGVTPQGNDMPSGYIRTAQNIVCKIMTDPNNPGSHTNVPVSNYAILDAWLEKEPEVLHFESQIEIRRIKQINIELKNVGGMEMRKTLQEQGFLVPNVQQTGEFLLSWIKHLQEMRDSVASAPFGWQNTNGQTEGFVYGGQIWTPNGNSPAASANPVINQQYKPKGSDVYWQDAVKLVTLCGRPDLEAIVASAFAAPLVMFTGHSGMLMSAYSKESGIGKTTAQIAAQAVWGNPITGRQSLSDTQNSVVSKIGQVRSLPIYWDELHTDEDTSKFVNLTFQITGGKEKSRLNRSAEMKEPRDWQTMVVSCGNESLVDHVTHKTSTTTAGLYRIFEFRVEPVPDNHSSRIDTSVAQVKLAKLNNNYGLVGLEYARWLGKNFKQVEADMAALSKQLDDETSSTREERFWISLIACILQGAKYSNTLGYSVFELTGLKNFMLQSLANMRNLQAQQTGDLTKSINISSILSAFYRDMIKDNRVVHTDRIHVAKGKPPKTGSPNGVKVLWPSDISRINGVVIQVGRNDKLVRFSSSAFGEWLKKQGKNRTNVIEALRAKVPTTNVVGYVASGTPLASFAENTIQIDTNGSPDFDFIDEIQ